jgi:hypothetical protein
VIKVRSPKNNIREGSFCMQKKKKKKKNLPMQMRNQCQEARMRFMESKSKK